MNILNKLDKYYKKRFDEFFSTFMFSPEDTMLLIDYNPYYQEYKNNIIKTIDIPKQFLYDKSLTHEELVNVINSHIHERTKHKINESLNIDKTSDIYEHTIENINIYHNTRGKRAGRRAGEIE